MKKCKECEKEFYGRTDKIYCNRKCKDKARYKAQERILPNTRSIDKILHKNYLILTEELKGKVTSKKIDCLKLEKKQFNFNYITNYRVNKKGKVYHYVYDHAWMAFSDNQILLIKQKKSFS